MKTTLIHLNEQATETLEAMLDPGYIHERTGRLQAIEDFLLDQWRDAQAIKPEAALTFLDTLRSLRKDFGTFLTSVDPSGEADDRQTLNMLDNE